jgi:CheY-like chemotaxis protein
LWQFFVSDGEKLPQLPASCFRSTWLDRYHRVPQNEPHVAVVEPFVLPDPRMSQPAAIEPSPTANAEIPERATCPPAGRFVLVVDDEPGILESTKTLLQTIGYRVLAAGGGRQALELLRQHGAEIGAILLDLTMPHVSGVETLRAIRQMFPDVPVLLSSGHSADEALAQVARLGVSGFIQKPYRARALREALGPAFTPSPGGPPNRDSAP